jgi:hypothetical protein
MVGMRKRLQPPYKESIQLKGQPFKESIKSFLLAVNLMRASALPALNCGSHSPFTTLTALSTYRHDLLYLLVISGKPYLDKLSLPNYTHYHSSYHIFNGGTA